MAACFEALPTAYVCAYLVGEGGWDPCGRVPPASEERLEGPAIGNKGFMEAELPACTARQTLISTALVNAETSILIQKRHPYTGKLNSDTSGDSKTAFLHCRDVEEHSALVYLYADAACNQHL